MMRWSVCWRTRYTRWVHCSSSTPLDLLASACLTRSPAEDVFSRQTNCTRQPRHAYLVSTTPTQCTMLTLLAGSHERLHIARARHGRAEQERCLPRNRGLMPKLFLPTACRQYHYTVPFGCALRHIIGGACNQSHQYTCTLAQRRRRMAAPLHFQRRLHVGS